MKILLFGKSGQVGWALQRSLAPLGELVALDTRSNPLGGDFSYPDSIAETVRRVAPDVIVNAAAYTAVDKAESEATVARLINAETPAVLAREAALSGALLVHYSSDYVFDGSGIKPWAEDDRPGPLSVYGKSKLEGDEAIVAAGCRHLIFRTSWVYGLMGQNFAKTMLRLARERDSLNIIADQIGAPTGADLLADVTAHAIARVMQCPEMGGVYHLAASGQTSWHEYACFVIEFARAAGVDIKVAPAAIHAIASEAYPAPAPRPRNSRLDTARFEHVFGLRLPHWKEGVGRMLTEIFMK
jgi:dTDP-4-dehydrorhamnose reductase